MWSVVSEIIRVLNESAIYLLLGFALAGVLHVYFSRSPRFMQLLSGTGTKSVVLAALLGIPLPLCSCSVLPAGIALRKQGASKGATAAFLVSVPETDILSILLTYGLLGPLIAIFRPLAAAATAIATGCAINLTERWARRQDTPAATPEAPPAAPPGCECETRPGVVRTALKYGFVEFFDDIIGSLMVGLLLGGVITALLPTFELTRFMGNSLLMMLAMLVIGIPMYVCAASSTPIAVGLIATGVSPGAALVFLLAGPATNMATFTVLLQHLGRLATVVYVVCIAVISVLMGLWLDAIVYSASAPISLIAVPVAEYTIGPVKGAAALAFLLLTILSLRRTRWLERMLERLHARTGLRLRPRGAKIAVLVCLVVGYLGTGLFVVRPGERAIVTRFGAITQLNLRPGLHYRWPTPFGRADIESIVAARRVELGFRRADESQNLAGESWMLTGNEDIIDIKWAVHYQIQDSPDGGMLRDYLYGVGDKEALIRGAAEWAIRTAVGSRDIDTLLTTARRTVEAAIQSEFLQPALDRCAAGIRIIKVNLLDVHAAPDVHYAFRDIASAAEDKMTTINLAYEYDERVVREARGEAARRVAAAQGRGTQTAQHARGEAFAFRQRVDAYRQHPGSTRLRLYFESVDGVLAELKKYVNLSATALNLWLVEDGQATPLPFAPSGAPRR
ncbi:MAG: permease [Planctomycetes bacterium]|nr:permease [Planctomycetota bacterium]